jgi:hypothetical protein
MFPACRPLLAAYAATTYRAGRGRRAVALRCGQRGPVWLGQGAFLTAWDPRSTRQSRGANNRAQARLRALLRRAGLQVLDGFGLPDGGHPGEAMLLVHPLPPRQAARLGRQWRQNAVVLVGRNRQARLCCLR